jgi:hypothetical protein
VVSCDGLCQGIEFRSDVGYVEGGNDFCRGHVLIFITIYQSAIEHEHLRWIHLDRLARCSLTGDCCGPILDRGLQARPAKKLVDRLQLFGGVIVKQDDAAARASVFLAVLQCKLGGLVDGNQGDKTIRLRAWQKGLLVGRGKVFGESILRLLGGVDLAGTRL